MSGQAMTEGEAVESIAQSLHALGHDAVAWDVPWNELFEAEREGLRGSARYLLKHHAFTHAGMQASEGADSARLDWLERQHVEVRTPLRFGSRPNFQTTPGPDEDDETSDLRAQIDAARATQEPTR